jgi:hypothetical protein
MTVTLRVVDCRAGLDNMLYFAQVFEASGGRHPWCVWRVPAAAGVAEHLRSGFEPSLDRAAQTARLALAIAVNRSSEGNKPGQP